MNIWEITLVLVVLKIPVGYVAWVTWWAIKAEPEIGAEGGTDGIPWRPWRQPSSTRPSDRPSRGGPHGVPTGAARRRQRGTATAGVGK